MNICTEAEAEMALAESGYNTSDIKSAVNCFHGNIGMCTDYILDENLRNTVSLTKSLTDSIVRKNEYELCRLLCSVGNDRIRVKSTLIQFNNLVRDAAILGRDINADVIGCSREQAERLLNVVTVGGAVKIHGIIEKTWKTIECNVSVPLAMTTMCAEIMQIIK
jgi:DNA polymerase-3 subunit delta'